MVVGNGQLLLDVERSLDKGGEEARGNVPLKMAVEKPNAWREKKKGILN